MQPTTHAERQPSQAIFANTILFLLIFCHKNSRARVLCAAFCVFNDFTGAFTSHLTKRPLATRFTGWGAWDVFFPYS